MALRAWLSSRLKALIGTSSHTGSTATVERLLAGLVTSGLDATLDRPSADPAAERRECVRVSVCVCVCVCECVFIVTIQKYN